MAQKIDYENKVITKLCDYLTSISANFTIEKFKINITANEETVTTIFSTVVKIVAGTKYTAQEDTTSFQISIFNSNI